MKEKFGWAWACVFNKFYELKDSVPKYYQLLGWNIVMHREAGGENVCLACMSENQDPLPLARWFGTDTTNTTMDDMKDLFDKYDQFSISLTFRNNGVELVENAVVELIRCNEKGLKPIDADTFNKNALITTGIFLKGKRNEANKNTEDKSESNVTEA